MNIWAAENSHLLFSLKQTTRTTTTTLSFLHFLISNRLFLINEDERCLLLLHIVNEMIILTCPSKKKGFFVLFLLIFDYSDYGFYFLNPNKTGANFFCWFINLMAVVIIHFFSIELLFVWTHFETNQPTKNNK